MFAFLQNLDDVVSTLPPFIQTFLPFILFWAGFGSVYLSRIVFRAVKAVGGWAFTKKELHPAIKALLSHLDDPAVVWDESKSTLRCCGGQVQFVLSPNDLLMRIDCGYNQSPSYDAWPDIRTERGSGQLLSKIREKKEAVIERDRQTRLACIPTTAPDYGWRTLVAKQSSALAPDVQPVSGSVSSVPDAPLVVSRVAGCDCIGCRCGAGVPDVSNKGKV